MAAKRVNSPGKKKTATKTTGKKRASTPRKKSPPKKRAAPKKEKSGQGKRFFRALGALFVAGMTLLLLWLGLAYLAVVYEVRDRMAGQRWELPTQFYPKPLALRRGQTLPPGDFGDLLNAMGYSKRSRVQRAGEYRPANGGLWYVYPYEDSALGTDADGERLAITLSGRKVTKLVGFDSKKTLNRVEIPGLPFAEIHTGAKESRRILKSKEFPQYLQDAVVAIEDQRFYSHGALDPIGITRAIFVNVTKGGMVQGGSTLTQQTAKNFFLTHERTFSRKFREVLYSVALERNYPKESILELYLNEIYLGQEGSLALCGFGEASYAYFSKTPDQLTIAEAALLAGIIQAPNALNPERHPEKSLKRRNVVLAKMAEQGYISQAQKKSGQSEKLKLRKGRYPSRSAPWFVEKVLGDLGSLSDPQALSEAGFRIQTTLDWRVQKAAERALESHLKRLGKSELQGAVVVLDPATGDVLALVGGRDFETSQFNRALMAKRQPGSAFKPIVLAAAFRKLGSSLTPTTLLQDEPLTLKTGEGSETWSPKNFDNNFRGDVTTRLSMEKSYNIPMVRLAESIGISSVVDTARRAGITSACADGVGGQKTKDCSKSAKDWQHPSLALGSKEVTPIELGSAYTALASNGHTHPAHSVRFIRDRDGGKVEQEGLPRSLKLLSPDQAWLIRDILRGVVEQGTAKSAKSLGYKHPAAGKTGTTNGSRDAWFVGFDEDYLTVVWVGYDNNKKTGYTGGSAALPIWVSLMKTLRGPDAPPRDPMPASLVERRVCLQPPVLDCMACEEFVDEKFWASNAPARDCGETRRPIQITRTQVRSWLQRFMDEIREN